MSDPIAVIDEGGKRYNVFYDEAGYYEYFGSNMADYFESEEDKADQIRRYERGDFSFYAVVEQRLCECCGSYVDTDNNLVGIQAESVEDALDSFKECAC